MDGLRLELEVHSLFQSLFSLVLPLSHTKYLLSEFSQQSGKDAQGRKKQITFCGATDCRSLTQTHKSVAQYSMFV